MPDQLDDFGYPVITNLPPVAAPTNAPAPAVVGPPAGPVVPPPPRPQISPDMQERLNWAATVAPFRNMPYDQAARAVSTAMRFEAQRGYQRDLANGVSAADAMTKWAPLLFASPTGGSVGQAGAFIRAVRPPPPLVLNAGGVLYGIGPDGQAKALTPRPPIKMTPSALDVADERDTLNQINSLQKAIDEDPTGPSADDNRGKLQYLRGQLRDIRARAGMPLTAAVASPKTVTSATPAKATDILPLPKRKEDLIQDTTYQTSRGPARWDGEHFHLVR